ncbi:MAG: glycosyltransferase family 39 protein [Chloroflexia bacterium]
MARSEKAGRPGFVRRLTADPGRLALLCLFLLSLPLVTPRIYAVDSVEYYVYLPSLLFDGDLDFGDEYAYFHERNPHAGIEGVLSKRDATTGLPLNVAPVGTALLWSPAYLATHGILWLGHALGAPVKPDGLSRPYILAVCYASTAYAFAGLLLAYRLCRRRFAPFPSALAVSVAWLATPAFFYSHASPPWSHSASLFAVALFVTVWDKTRVDSPAWRFFVLGLLGGLVALVREQDGLFLVLPALDALLGYSGVVHRRAWKDALPLLGRHLLLGTGAALAFTPQLAVYRVLNGRFGPNPTVSGKFDWASPHFLEVLFDPHYGLIVWSPVVLFALFGLLLLCRQDRRLGIAACLAFLAQVYLAGCFLTWQGPGSFGQRRFINCVVLFALGLAALIALAQKKGWPAGALVAVGGAFVLWNAGLMTNWILYPAERNAGLLWDRLPRRLFVEIPQQALDLLRRLFFARHTLYRNPGG